MRPALRRRSVRIAVGVAAGLVVAAAVGAVSISFFDWNRARGWLGQRASEAIGRRVEIRGSLALSWVRAGAGETGLARFVPWPQLDAHDIAVGNPEGLGQADMISARHLRLRLRVLPLFERRLSFGTVVIEGLDAGLVVDRQGRNNWTFTPRRDDGGVPWTVQIQRLLVRHARVTLADAAHELDLEGSATSLDDPPYGLALAVRGRYRGERFSGQGRAGSLLELAEATQAFPIDFALDSASVHLAASGHLTRATPPAEFDVKLALSMGNLAAVYPLTGIALPATPAVRTSGRLIGRRDQGIGRYTYENFSATIGRSDLAGTVSFALTRPRPRLTGAVHSKGWRLADLGPSVGAGSAQARAGAGTERVLPSEPFRVERLDAMDAEVQASAGQLAAAADIAAEALETTIKLEAGLLTLDPLAFRLAGGKVGASIVFDRRGSEPKARLRASLDRLEMKKLVPQVPELHHSLGVINARIDIGGSGDSVARLLGSADGDVQVLMNRGSFSKILLEKAGLNVGNVVLGTLFGDRQIKLNCLAARFSIRNGIADTRSFLLDTEEARVPMTGTISLRDEKLDLTLRPAQKGLRVLSLRAPIHVSGSFAHPDVSVDKGIVAARAGGAIALGLLAPITAVLPLVATASDDDSVGTCNEALARAAEPAGTPGKRP